MKYFWLIMQWKIPLRSEFLFLFSSEIWSCFVAQWAGLISNLGSSCLWIQMLVSNTVIYHIPNYEVNIERIVNETSAVHSLTTSEIIK